MRKEAAEYVVKSSEMAEMKNVIRDVMVTRLMWL